MVGKSKKPTKAQERRFRAIQDIGCVVCRKEGYYNVPAEIHHVVEGAYRRGHDSTYGICPYHHRGLCFEGMTQEMMYKVAGPSLALNAKAYHERYGSEQELLSEQNRLIEEWEEYIV